MQNRVVNEGPLLDSKGNLVEAGYAFSLIKDYDRSKIKAGKLRIKEWDYYLITNNDYAIAVTIDDNSYMNLMSVSVLNFKEGWEHTKSYMHAFSNGKVNLPSTSKIGDVSFKDKNCDMNFYNDGKIRHLVCKFKNLYDHKDFSLDVTLTETLDDSMVILTPFNKKKHFYYNQKINCLKANGMAKFGDQIFDLNNSYGVLDWGRGVWTYRNTWYWSSLNATYNGHIIGFNLGYGFGNTLAASENMFFFDNKAYKLNDVSFNIPGDGTKHVRFMDKWHFTSSDGAIDMEFVPVLDRQSADNVVIIKSIQHQVFGKFSGKIKTDDGIVEFKDLLGFAEKVKNCW